MKNKRRLICIILTLVMFSAFAVPASASGQETGLPFIDVPYDAWYLDGLRYCYTKGFVSGLADKLFNPVGTVSRVQAASILYLAAGSPDVTGLSEPFVDVTGAGRDRDAIVWAYNKGIMSGVTGKTFSPLTHVSRGQFAVLLYRCAGSPSVTGKLNCKDAALIPADCRDAVIWSCENGIISGCEGGFFNFFLPLNRAQMVAAIAKYSRLFSEPREAVTELKVATFNINHCVNHSTGKIDYDAFAECLRSLDADIIALNEVRGSGILPDYDAQAAILAQRLGYHYCFAPAIGIKGILQYGNAVLTRLNVKSYEVISITAPLPHKLDSSYETRCLLKLRFADPDITVIISHFGLNSDEKEAAVKTVVKNIPDGKCILMGDFNVTPDDPVLNPIREKLCDTADSSADELLTYPCDGPFKKVDYIFVSPDIAVRSVRVPPVQVSDHRPYTAELVI